MANFYTYFETDTIGVQPANFTRRWDTVDSTWTVESESEPPSIKGKVLVQDHSDTTRNIITFDDVGTPSDSEILIRLKHSFINTDGSVLIYLRASGTLGNENGYYLYADTAFSQIRWRLYKLVNGVSTLLGTYIEYTISSNEYFFIRFQSVDVSPSQCDLKFKVWKSDHVAEPTEWANEISDSSTPIVNGWVGFGTLKQFGEMTVDAVAATDSVGTASFPDTEHVRATQAASLALDASESSLRITQAAILTLYKEAQPLRTTQAAITSLDATISAARINQAAVLSLVTNTPCVEQRAQCWKITRKDGQAFLFTTHDLAVSFFGETYKPCYSLRSSASDGGIINNGSAGDTTITGLLSDESITEFDLVNGLFDGATVEVWVVPWSDPQYKTDSPRRLALGILGKTQTGGVTYTIEMLSPGAKLATKPLLETCTPACRYKLGDGRCPVDINSLTLNSSVESVEKRSAYSKASHRRFTDSLLSQDDGYFDFGVLTWITGDNANLSSEIKTYQSDVITLWQPMPNEIKPGDQYSISPGCNKTVDDHKNKFGLDMVDFGGFPDIPGNDVLTRTPNAKG